MITSLTRTRALLLLMFIAVTCGWSLSIAPSTSHTVALEKAGKPNNLDRQLTRKVAERVASGEPFYTAAIETQRAGGYPLKPFVTVRPPTLILLGATFGWQAMQIVLLGLLGLAVVAWYPLFAGVTRAEAVTSALAIFLGGAFATWIELVVQYEAWAGFLIAIALALRGRSLWPLEVACIALALAIREFAVVYAGLALAAAVWDRRWREAATWLAVIALFAAFMGYHYTAVEAAILPGDHSSPGWQGLRGAHAVLQDLSTHSLLFVVPSPLIYLVTALGPIGLLGMPVRQARFALGWMLLFALAIALFTRDENDYWCMMLLPTWFLGYAFLPRLAWHIYGALAGREARL